MYNQNSEVTYVKMYSKYIPSDSAVLLEVFLKNDRILTGVRCLRLFKVQFISCPVYLWLHFKFLSEYANNVTLGIEGHF